jgi:hypothetical protein
MQRHRHSEFINLGQLDMVSTSNFTRQLQTAAKYVTNFSWADNFGFLRVFP